MGENKSNVFLAWNLGRKNLSKTKDHNNMVIFGLRSVFLVLFLLCLSLVLSSSSSVYASTYSLGLTTSGTVSVDVSTAGDGTAISEDELTVTSTCPLGYTITIQGPSDTNLYKDGNSANNNTTTKISPSTGTVSNPVSITGNNQGTWGYALGDNITTASDFIGLTSTSNTLITKAQQSGDGTVLTDTIPVYYGVSVQPNQVPGLYTMAESQTGAGDNVVTYFITTPTSCTSYTVSFNPTSTAGGNTLSGTGTMGSQTIPEGVATPLNPNSFTAPEGYVFKEWNTSQDGTGTSYTDGQSVTDLTTVGQNLTLYAQWKPREYTITFITNSASSIVFNGVAYTNGQTTTVIAGTYHIYGNYATRYAFSSWTATAGTFENQTYQNTAYTVTGDTTITLTGQQVTTTIQNLAYANCPTTATPVYDTRDNSVYWIQKLPDNNCWMLDNLALDLTSSTIVNALSTSNTHLDTTSLTYFKNGGGTASDRYPITAYSTFGSTNSYSQPLTNMASKDITLRPASAENYTNSIEGAYGQGQGKVGAYYNYCAASVGYYCFGNGTSGGRSSGNNYYDVCPAGWRMPTGGAGGEYGTLYATSVINSDATIYRNALSTPLSGDFFSGLAENLGVRGGFWSSTRFTLVGRMYDMNVDSDDIYPTDTGNRHYGSSVRCVLDLDPSYSITVTAGSGVSSVSIDGGPAGATASGTFKAGQPIAITATKGTSAPAVFTWSSTGAGTLSLTSNEGTNAVSNTFTVGAGTGAVTVEAVDALEMQSMTPSLCTTTGTLVYDNRDNSIYTVKKLADNNCWLLDNLRLDLTSSAIVNGLTIANTNASSAALVSLRSGNRTNGDQYATEGLTLSNWTSGSGNTTPKVNISYNNTVASVTYGDGSGKIGAYYNYCAATAGSFCYSTSIGMPSSPLEDICPRNWRMPTGRDGEFSALYEAYSSDADALRNALATPLSGYVSSGTVSDRGTSGKFWSATRTGGAAWVSILDVSSSAASVASGTTGTYGYSVRCIYDSDYHTVTATAGNGISSVSINGGPAGTTVSESFRPGEIVTIAATSSSSTTPSTFTWSSTGDGTLGTTTSTGISSTTNAYTVGSNDSTITVAYSASVTTEMQNLSSSLCTTAGTYVYDSRDNEVYLIRKLADNKCWMLDNLRLDLTNSTIVNNVTTSNTNVSSASLTSLLSGNRANGDQYATEGLTLSDWTGVWNGHSYSAPLVNTWYKNKYVKSLGDGSGRVGVYYNFCAASAGSYCYGDGSTSVTVDTNATEDICPKGWHMPTGGNNYGTDFYRLYNAYSGNAENLGNAFSAVYSGYFNSDYSQQGGQGDFWSSTVNSLYNYRMSTLHFIVPTSSSPSGSVYITSGVDRKHGSPIRCILNS